jgi:hypothetical protein
MQNEKRLTPDSSQLTAKKIRISDAGYQIQDKENEGKWVDG